MEAENGPEIGKILVKDDGEAPRGVLDRTGPFLRGYIITLGALAAIATGLALFSLRSILFSIFFAAFITVGLDPLVRWFQRRGLSRTGAVLSVIGLLVVVIITIVWVVVPTVVEQVSALVTAVPEQIQRLTAQGWFDGSNAASNGVLGAILAWMQDILTSPETWGVIGSGALGLGFSIADAIASGIFIAVLTIYFVGAYDTATRSAYQLVAASRRETFIRYSDRILQNVGKYLSGMVVLAFCNAVFSIILLLIVGVPGAFVIGFVAFFITLIPLIGTVLTTAVMTVLAFIHSPTAGLIVLILMLVYMQVEAYLLTPKVMSKAVQVPGSIVLISAMAGGTLFGLAGALVAIPLSAGVLIIITEVVIPLKQRR
ncbi:AI-2E family transporter [Klugiella xanthotipulae]|uniref:Putative PurR-regulated permease PerM n=1 Tax=Klugiella xanthotipulae TaxID=244735 RepID=A0A543HY97_9MICO|nr:AI-2E family transporter [Klugiella xanthotipulae]TQM63334.1 putative PurR-regulated permease PerM [Klugiella xanthotipulae]